jgi:hypothetical protein
MRHRLENALRDMLNDARIRQSPVAIGEVYLWRRVEEGWTPRDEWRAQFAYPKSLLLPYEARRSAAALRWSYGVKVTVESALDTRER